MTNIALASICLEKVKIRTRFVSNEIAMLNPFALPKNKNLSYRNLDGLRFLFACAVVAFHYNQYLAEYFPFSEGYTSNIYYMVDAFFIISGIVISMVYAHGFKNLVDYKRFLCLRLARLYPLHFLTLAFYVALGLLYYAGYIHVVNPAKYDFRDLLPNLLLIHAWGFARNFSFNYVSWAISAEFFCYLCFPFVLFIFKKTNVWKGALGLIILGLAMYWGVYYFLKTFPQSPNYNISFLRNALIGFSFGSYIYQHRTIWGSRLSEFSTRFLANFLLITMAGSLVLSVPAPLCRILVYATVWALFIADEKRIALLPARPLFSNLSDLSYSIYMVHTIATTLIVSFLFPTIFGRNAEILIASLVFCTLVTFALAILSLNVIETPARQKLRKIIMRHFPS